MMDSVRFEIHGADNVHRHISNMLRDAEEQLQANCEPFATEMLFTVLEGINYICLDLVKPKQEANFSLTIPVLEPLRWFTVALDPILRLSGGIIKAPSVESLEAITKRFLLIIAAVIRVQFWRRAQELHQINPMEFVVAEGDKLIDPEESEFYTALNEVMNKLGPDLNWRRYFTEQILRPRLEEERPLYDQAFRQYYELEEADFAALKVYFRGVSQSYIQRVASLQVHPLESNRSNINVLQGFHQAKNVVFGILQGAMPAKRLPRFTPLALREQVLADLQNEMRSGKVKAQKCLEALEYYPGKDVFRHPIIPLIENGQKIYALLPWAFYPAQICSDQWDGELFMLLKPQSKWAKTIGQWYGNGFCDYVSKMLQAIGIADLLIDQEISITEFGDQLTPWLRRLPKVHKGAFRPDIIFQKNDMAFVISCKAEDLYFDYWLLRNYLFMPASKMRRTIEKDIASLREVSIWGECIASTKSIRQRLGIQAKSILPILATSRKEPLGSPVLRRYLARKEVIPAVPTVTADELKGFITSGFDISVLPLPHPPQLFTVDNCTHHVRSTAWQGD